MREKNTTKSLLPCQQKKSIIFLIDAMHLIGDTVNVSIGDYGKDFDKVHEYFCYSKDTFLLESTFMDYKSLILQNGDIYISLWSVDNRIEMQLDRVKHFIFFVEEVFLLTKLLDFYKVSEKDSLRFFPQGRACDSE